VLEPYNILDGDGSMSMKSFGKHWRLLPVVPLVALLLALMAIPASANPGLTVSGAMLVTDVSPGGTLTHKMTVSIGNSDSATDITVQVAGMTQSLDGVNEPLPASEDISSYSARSFISVDKSSFHMEPGTSQEVTATVHIPQDVGDGGRYAIINIQTQAAGGAGINVITAANVPIALTIKGSQLVHTGKITELSIGNFTSRQPVNILTNFQNTGNHHFKVKGEVAVMNAQGQSMGTIFIPVTASSILPGMVRKLQATFMPTGELAPGTYTVSSKVMLEDGTVLDEADSTFKIKTPYAPPPAVGNITLTPSSASTLTSEDGRISIYFPQGAAVIPVNVSLWNYPAEQLPSPPPDMNLTTTCFRVDGLTGLLAKEATVTVRYSADDLGKAGGDTSRLRLARWDEGNSQWTVLKTRVDTGAMTLSASSNQMSIWAVVVGSPAAAGASWVTPVAAAAGVIVLALLVLLLLRGRRRRGKLVK
jgi:hypothetical protein